MPLHPDLPFASGSPKWKPVVAVDPGAKKIGVALFLDGRLVEAMTLIEAKTSRLVKKVRDLAPDGAVLFIERMEKRRQFGEAHDDLRRVTATSEKIAARFDEVSWIRPRQWKGNVPKPVCQDRIRAELYEDEKAALRDQGHDTYDAIGIGLVAVGRLGRGLK